MSTQGPTTPGPRRRSARPTRPAATPIARPTPGVGMPQQLRAAAPDREARAFLGWLNLFAPRRADRYSVAGLRWRWRLLARSLGEGMPAARVREHRVAGPDGPIALKVFEAARSALPRPALLWCHGGGFMVGDADCADAMCRAIAHASGCIVVAVRYRLAPEHDLHAGRADVLAALHWLTTQGTTLGIDPTRLAIGGDSAGGNIAAAVAQRYLRDCGTALRLQVLVYPATDLRHDYPSKAENARGYLLTADAMDWIKSHIIGSLDLGDPRLSPARSASLKGLPPALILTAGYDPVRDDGLDYAARLRAAGVAVELLHYAGQFHGFLNLDAVLVAGRDALQRIGCSLAAAFASGPPADRTIEIADPARQGRRLVRRAAGELVTAALIGWESAGRWSTTMLHLLSPTAAASNRLLWRPWLVSAATLRRGMTRLAVRQTHPARHD